MLKKILCLLATVGLALLPNFCFASVEEDLVEAGGYYEVPLTSSETEKFQISATKDIHTYDVAGGTLVGGYLKIEDLKFHDHGSFDARDTTEALGITGSVYNSSNQNLLFRLEADYYDASGHVIAVTRTWHLAPANKTVRFVSMEDPDSFRLFNASDEGAFDITVPTSMALQITDITDADLARNSELASQRENVSGNYVYDSYQVTVNVHEDESFDVRELMTANFLAFSHGIIRHLPSRYETDTIGKRRARIDNISVNQEFTKSNNSSDHTIDIKIGDPMVTVSGDQVYDIKYTYVLDKEKESQYDEFYYNLIQDTVDISNIDFEVTMPKDFDISRIGFTSGRYGSRSNNVIYYVDGNQIIGYYDGILSNGAVTIRVAMEDGYFANEGIPYIEPGSMAIVGIVAPLLLLAFVFVLWYLFGRDERHPETVEFYPPDDLNSLDIQFYYKGSVDSDGVVSLLTYLASKGYLAIEKRGESGRSFVLKKLRDYDGNNEAEREFMQKLFPGSRTITKATQLRNSFYRTVNHIIKTYNDDASRSKIFVTSNRPAKVIAVLCLIATVLIPSIVTIMDLELSDEALGSIIIITILIAFYTPFFYCGAKIDNVVARVFVLGFCSVHAFAMLAGFSGIAIESLMDINPFYIIIGVTALICIALEAVLIAYMPKRNQHGAMMYARVSGFRNFLQTAERTRLEMLVGSDPTYFYNIIPYAYALGVSKKWMRQFEDILLSEPPEWYSTDDGSHFDYRSFREFMDTTVSSVSNAMTSTPSSSGSSGGGGGGGSSSGGGSSGGSSGGGSSGGGGGGGGSSSW